MPLGAVSGGVIYLHETGNDAAGQPMVASFVTGYFEISEGEDFPFIDQIYLILNLNGWGSSQRANPDEFLVVNYPGDAPVSYGPYTVTSSTEYISVRFRARQNRYPSSEF